MGKTEAPNLRVSATACGAPCYLLQIYWSVCHPPLFYLSPFCCTAGALAFFLGVIYLGSKRVCLFKSGPFSVRISKYLGILLGAQELAILFRPHYFEGPHRDNAEKKGGRYFLFNLLLKAC